jgi:sugar lactone lactonase YvrE
VRPDGLAIAADGTMFVAGTYGSHSVAVLTAAGELIDELGLDPGSKPSNCCITPGALWVTDSALGRLLRFDVDATPMLGTGAS